MHRLLVIMALLAGLGLSPHANAQDAGIALDGESFTKKFVGNSLRGDKLLEFVRDGESAVVSLQLAYRFTDVSPEGAQRFKELRQSWFKQAAAFDMKLVHDALDKQAPGTGTLKPPTKF